MLRGNRYSKDVLAYIRDIRSLGHELLNPIQERELGWKIINDSDMEARDKLVGANVRLVVSIAKRFWKKNRNLHPLDIVGYGNAGLMRATERFDPAFGMRFSTYAVWWIKQAIGKGIYQEQKKIVGLPSHAMNLAHYLADNPGVSFEDFLENSGNNKYTRETMRSIYECFHSIRSDVDSDGKSWSENIGERIERMETARIISEALDGLTKKGVSERDRNIFVDSLDKMGVSYTDSQNGEIHKMTRERARQVVVRVTHELKRDKRLEALL